VLSSLPTRGRGGRGLGAAPATWPREPVGVSALVDRRDGTGFELVRTAQEICPDATCILYTETDPSQFDTEASRGRVAEYVGKGSAFGDERLTDIVRTSLTTAPGRAIARPNSELGSQIPPRNIRAYETPVSKRTPIPTSITAIPFVIKGRISRNPRSKREKRIELAFNISSFEGSPMNVLFSTDIMDYQALRAMGYTTFGGAEPGEVFVTADRIDGASADRWYEEWSRTADRVMETAEAADGSGHARTARGAYFRAHNYYRVAEFFLPSDDDRRIPTYERSVETFREGVSLLQRPPERIAIPYDDGELPAYLFLPPDATTTDEPLPTVVCFGGFDSIAEELYFACGVPEALARGYAVVIFDGPGQGAPLRYEGLTARRDWENVVGPVIDDLETRPELDDDRIALVGLSFGGYYAPRAAAFEDRVSACVALGHMYDPFGAAMADSPRAAAVIEIRAHPPAFP